MVQTLWVGLAFFVTSAAVAQPTPIAFEVATVRPSPPLDMAAMRAGRAHIGTRIDAARVDIGYASLFRLICIAYQVKPYRVAGPDWLKTTMYDIQAKIPDGVSPKEVPEMLQSLLIERFGLKVHLDSKDQQVYALVVGKGGPKMKESAPDPPPANDAPKPDAEAKADSMSIPTVQGDVKMTPSPNGATMEMPGGEISGKLRMSMNGSTGTQPGRLHLETSGTTMRTLAEMLSVGVVDRPVVDMTGLKGNYDVAADLSVEDAMNAVRTSVAFGSGGGGKDGPVSGGAASDPTGFSVFSSIQNLGLKLEPRKLPLEMLVVDHIERVQTGN